VQEEPEAGGQDHRAPAAGFSLWQGKTMLPMIFVSYVLDRVALLLEGHNATA
jgi:hypothetical protein